MDDVNIIRIIASAIYILITFGVIVMIVRNLRSGIVRQWMRGYPESRSIMIKTTFPNLEMYESQGAVQGSHLVFDKNKFPKEYWASIRLRLIFLIIFLIIGFGIYSKIF